MEIDPFCVYCRTTEDLTVDHIPPQNLFERPRPSCLITVPARHRCNHEASLDDEYFRYALSMSDATGVNPKASKGRQTALRSLARQKASGFKRRILSALRPVEIRTPGGLIVGRRIGYEVELERVFKVVRRIVRGLFYHETARTLPPDHEILVHCDDTLREYLPNELDEIKNTIIDPLANRAAKVIESNTFFYRFQLFDENPNMSVWALTFFCSISFLAISGRDERSSSMLAGIA